MSIAACQTKKSTVEAIAEAVLYEGYMLYPYRPSSVKNQQRWNFGVVCPPTYAIAQRGNEISTMQTECLCEVDASSRVKARVRFLHLMMREVAESISDCLKPVNDCGHLVGLEGKHFRLLPNLYVDGRLLQSWQEAVEREVVLEFDFGQGESAKTLQFSFPPAKSFEAIAEKGSLKGLVVRTQQKIEGEVEVTITPLRLSGVSPDKAQLSKLSVVIRNSTELPDAHSHSRDDVLMRSCVSTHTILEVSNGAFASTLDPPDEYQEAVSICTNIGTFPVLVGDEGARDCVLSSPIILYDYPKIAPQSPGNLFDGTEIDEILTLRIMSLTDDEKNEMRSADEMARNLLERTEAMSAADLMNLHGVMSRKL